MASQGIKASNETLMGAASGAGFDFGVVAPYGPLDFKNDFKGRAPAAQLAAAGNVAYGAYMSATWGSTIGDLGAKIYATGLNLLGAKAQKFMAPNGMSKSGALNIPTGNANPGCLKQ